MPNTDNNSIKPGDKALIVASRRDCQGGTEKYLGTECKVLSAAYEPPLRHVAARLGIWMPTRVHDVECFDGAVIAVARECLMKRPPDEELHRMFRETEKPMGVHA